MARIANHGAVVWGLLIAVVLAQKSEPIWVVLWALAWGSILYTRQSH